MGERGAYLAPDDGIRAQFPAYPVRAADTTAAGDAFNGAFAVALARGVVRSKRWNLQLRLRQFR